MADNVTSKSHYRSWRQRAKKYSITAYYVLENVISVPFDVSTVVAGLASTVSASRIVSQMCAASNLHVAVRGTRLRMGEIADMVRFLLAAIARYRGIEIV